MPNTFLVQLIKSQLLDGLVSYCNSVYDVFGNSTELGLVEYYITCLTGRPLTLSSEKRAPGLGPPSSTVP